MPLDLPVYLDHHATTPVDPRVFEAMRPWLCGRVGNAASTHHAFGRSAADAVEQARGQVSRLVGCEPREVCFTSGATEANNLVLKGTFDGRGVQGPGLTISAAEHRAVLDPARRLARSGTELVVLEVDHHGRVSADNLREHGLRDQTRLVSLIAANNEVGTLNPLRELAAACHERRVLFHTDATAWIGHAPFNLHELGCDFASLSAHKFGGPQGIGALLVRASSIGPPLRPLLEGGGQEARLRAGTVPVALVVGLGAACDIARNEMVEESTRLATLRDRLWDGLRRAVPEIIRNGDPDKGLTNTLNISVPEIDGDVLLTGLTDVAVSSGAACSSTNREPSHVLVAMGISPELARASLRFGLGRTTTPAEIEFAINYVATRIRELRRR